MDAWVKSSYSGRDGTDCVEWAPASGASGAIPVRDSKRPTGPMLRIPANAFASLVTAIKNDTLNA
ncbi:DUF397 domain-containing protein [Streptomyces huiliensis]|uniref:DUF397 domain-containing protein n=1 Tax=Streptomyces huiliensis TaxID=2876027 RepID=UPI001CBDF2B8|nr:DUF397 domain-containing protein [Streptomyces huiliensis]